MWFNVERHGTPAAVGVAMQNHHESFGDVMRAVRSQPDVSVSQTYQQTVDFIRDHPFFHHGLMNAPIGFGKHFRNVPFVGPGRMIAGVLTLNREAIAKGWQITRGTVDAK
jgi:hypothetical protein